MSGSSARPPLAERLRMPLRIAAVFGAYALYRAFEEQMAAAIMLGLGSIVLAWAVIERFTTWRRQRLEMMLVGQAILGLGLVALGAFLAST